jgi:PsbP
MRSVLAYLTLASVATTAGAYSIQPPKLYNNAAATSSSRRDWLASTVVATVAAAAATSTGFPTLSWASPLPSEDLTTFNDAPHGFSIAIPSTWSKSETELNDRRKIVVWGDPNDAKTALFIAYTPVRDDFTSLASFGAVDQVAAQTILPKAELAGDDSVEAKMIAAVSAKQAYMFDYTQAIANIQPPTHFRTIFTLQQGATGGAGAVLVTITLQTPEERYAASLKPLFDKIIESYGKNV